MAKWYCKDCDEIYDEDILLDYWYENTSTHFIEEVKCKCGNEELQEVIDDEEWVEADLQYINNETYSLEKVVELLDWAIKKLQSDPIIRLGKHSPKCCEV